jgi:hypothetical protein
MTEKTEVVDDTQADKDFEAGFTATVAAPVTAASVVVEDPALKADAPAPVVEDPAVVVAPPAAAPEYVQITKEQFASLEAAAAKVGDFDKKFDKAFGTVGGMQDVIKQLQSATPKGEAVVISDDMFAEMAEDYPQLAAQFRGVLEKVLKGARGTGTADPASVDPAVVTKMVADGIKQREMDALEDDHPGWKTIVGAVESAEKADPNNLFRKWLTTQSEAYRTKITSTQSASVLAKAIDRFKEATKTPPPPPKAPTLKDLARKANLKAAIPLRGDGNPPPPSKNADDEFEAGFRSG